MAATSIDPPPAAAHPAPLFQTAPNVQASASPASAGVKDEVESPSISNTSTALARFEFEAGRGSPDGTKVLMVEWDDDDTTRGLRGVWHLSWEGKRTVLPASDDKDSSDVHRAYFLLPPGVAVPSVVSLTHVPASASSPSEATPTVVWRTNPLPAIFPPELGASARAAGKKGVLHTIWAKKRLSVLAAEIAQELNTNTESVGLMMAVQERDWIEQNFGVATKKTAPAAISTAGASPSSYLSAANSASGAVSPSSPRSPGGGRLLEKLKGLKLGTSDSDLSFSGLPPGANPLSPESSDVAVSSFSTIKGLHAAPASQPPPHRRMASQHPPASLLAQQQQQSQAGIGGMASLDAFAGGDPEAVFTKPAPKTTGEEDERDESGLFALPMSPRSPEMTKSPFSFKVQDTRKYVGGTA